FHFSILYIDTVCCDDIHSCLRLAFPPWRGVTSSPLDVDSDPDIHGFPSAKELKDVTDCHWVIAHVTPPSWK
ncbi:hypothetical protein Tco_0108062, partial [Tanacetum coccineum]